MDFTLNIERDIQQCSAIIKRTLLDVDTSSINKFVFVDVSGSNKLVNYKGRSGTQVLTDRKKLALFFDLVHSAAEKREVYLLCDIVFNEPTTDDTLLGSSMSRLKNIVIPDGSDESGMNGNLFRDIPVGQTGFSVSSGFASAEDLVKYPIIAENGVPSLPAALYEQTDKVSFRSFAGFTFTNSRVGLNELIVDHRIQQWQLRDSKDERILLLDDLINLLSKNKQFFFNRFLAGRIIVLGDFENDVFRTVLGDLSGPVILCNIYLSLKYGDHLLSWKRVLAILTFLFILSWLILYPPFLFRRLQKWLQGSLLSFFMSDLLLFFLSVWLFSLVMYITSDFYFNVAILTLYASVANTIKEMWKRWKFKPEAA